MNSINSFLSILVTMMVIQDVMSSKYGDYYKKKDKTEPICNAVADIVFLFDESGSIPNDDVENYDDMVKFMMAVISGFDIGPDAVQFAVECFNTDTRTHFFLNDHATLPDIEAAIAAFRLTLNEDKSKETAIGDGLQAIRDKHFLESRGAKRPCAVEIIVVLTDGNSNFGSDPVPVATALKDEDDVKIFMVGIGSSVSDATLQQLSSGEDYILKVDDFDALANSTADLIEELCEQTVCTSNPDDGDDSDDKSGKSGGYKHGGVQFVPVPMPIMIQSGGYQNYQKKSNSLYDLKKLMNQMKSYVPMKPTSYYKPPYKPYMKPGSFSPT